MTIQNFSMVPGNSKTIVATVDNINLTDALIEFSVKRNNTVVLVKQDIAVVGNTLTIYLNPADTQSLSGEYTHDVVLTDGYGNVTTLFSGTFSFTKNNGLTAQQVFITAMNLMDEESEDGSYEGYPDEYKKKAWNILTMLQAELTPASSTPSLVTDESSTFYLDDRTCLTVLPYGLAAHLLIAEDQNRASFFNARYDELKRKRPAMITKIKDVYGMFPTEEPTSTVTVDTTTVTYDGGEF
jgi:hypothetical protein